MLWIHLALSFLYIPYRQHNYFSPCADAQHTFKEQIFHVEMLREDKIKYPRLQRGDKKKEHVWLLNPESKEKRPCAIIYMHTVRTRVWLQQHILITGELQTDKCEQHFFFFLHCPVYVIRWKICQHCGKINWTNGFMGHNKPHGLKEFGPNGE